MKHLLSFVHHSLLLRLIGLVWGVGLLVACSGDGYRYPSVRLELLTAYSGADGTLQHIVTDDGSRYPVMADLSDTHTVPDSLLRILANYQVDAPSATATADSAVTLYALAQVVAPLPQPLSAYPQGISRHPVDVVSIWMGYDYLNLLLTVREQQGRHRFGYVEEAVHREDDTLDVRLTLHHQVDDAGRQDYAKRVYLSVPLWPYLHDAAVSRLQVHFTLTLYSGEEKRYDFLYSPR